MSEQLVVGPINKGLRTDREPFVIDNDSFPILINAYQWRGRVKRKRGTSILGQLRRYIGTTNGAGNLVVTILPIPIPIGISVFIVGSNIFTDPGGASPVVLLTNGPGTATLDRATGVLTIVGSNPNTDVIFYPSLPVMGLEELKLNPNSTLGTIAFDTKYAYNISPVDPFTINDVSFYKKPAISASLPGYVPTPPWTPTSWNGQDYQQFGSVNYAGAFWATNGVPVPFSSGNIGMHYNFITAVAIVAGGPPAIVTITTNVNHNLVVGDFVFINEIVGMTGINFQTGYVIAIPAANQIQVEFPNATIAGAWTPPPAGGSGGIVQYLTNRTSPTVDCIRFYDGDPTGGTIPPTFTTGVGWVNYCPPLSQFDYSIADLPPDQYYLVGAKIIFAFKDRLLFFGPVVQPSGTATSPGVPIYLQDTVIYTQNGTPYYTTSYTNRPSAFVDTPTSILNIFNPLLVPINQTATSPALFEDQVGFGGFISAGVSDTINTVGSNDDALIVGFSKLQTRLIATGNDATGAFEFFLVNSELGSGSTFSTVNMDEGIITRGSRGYVISNQEGTQRIDYEILDQVFEINLDTNGNERFTAQRDFISEWIYFTYPSDRFVTRYPNETLQYNYRDNSYAIFYESYTTYGPFVESGGDTWATLPYPSWNAWTLAWNAGETTDNEPVVIGGNQQGFVIFRNKGIGESVSLKIQNISGVTITSPSHNLNEGDYVIFSGVLGTYATILNNNTFKIISLTTDTFNIDVTPPAIQTYLGGGYIKRLYIPFIQTKQFPTAWSIARKTRIGPQRYLFTTTDAGQVTVNIYLSQDSSDAFNRGPIVPSPGSLNSGLIFSQTVYTCPESTNLGLTPANINLNMLPGSMQAQIWHRMNTSLIGDTIQLGFTLSDAQIRSVNSQFSEVELHAFIMDVSPSMMLC